MKTRIILCALLAACGGDKTSKIDLNDPGFIGPISQNLDEGGPNPSPITVVLSNSGTCQLDFQAAASVANGVGWLSVSPASGNVAPGGTANLVITIDVVTPGLSGGLYTGT